MRGIRDRLLVTWTCVAAALTLSLAAAPGALATTSATDITSSGPLTNIFIGTDASCQVSYSGDTSDEFYGPEPGDCGTFLATGGTLYGADFANHSYSAANIGTPFTAVSQSAISGDGSSGHPYQVTTTNDAGTTGLRVTEVDSYVTGSESYETDITVSNSNSSPVSAILYHGGDCYLQNSDFSYGFVDPTTHGPACTENANNSPSGRIEEFQPITPGIHYVETYYGTLWSDISGQTDLPDTCDCTTNEDTSAGINWDLTVPANSAVTYSLITTFSPTGALPLSTAKTADSSTATANGSDGYTITISNPNASAVSLSSITDTLPSGFSYTTGSSTGATTSDPGISGQTLTWSGPISVPAASMGTDGTVSLHFDVTVSGANGTYYNNAGGTATGFTIAPTGATAPVTVTGGSGDQSDNGTGQAVNGTEGQSLSNVTVATFTDPDNDSTASDYSATIDWGDGTSSSAGTVSGSGGSYTVTGSHTYAEHGSYPVAVTITDLDSTSNTTPTNSTATIGEATLTPTAQAVSATEGHAFSGTVATFTDGDTAPAAGEYSATIDWGDGSSTSAGVITGSGGSFSVGGGNTYAEAGPYTVKVTVAETDNSATATSSSSTATVGDAALTGAGAGTLSSGPSFSGTVATFTDANASAPVSDFTASIDWGDSHTSSGTVSGSGGSYSVSGSHTYAAGGTFTVHVTITDDDGASSGPSTTIVVSVTNTAPSCSAVVARPARLWPPKHKFRLITLSGATDSDGDPLTWQITGVQQDEPVWGLGRGDASPDAKTGTSANSVYLRAERKGTGHGRLYFIAYTVSDGQGNSCNGVATVAVPHSRHQGTVPDTGQRYDSFSTQPRHHHSGHHHHHH